MNGGYGLNSDRARTSRVVRRRHCLDLLGCFWNGGWFDCVGNVFRRLHQIRWFNGFSSDFNALAALKPVTKPTPGILNQATDSLQL